MPTCTGNIELETMCASFRTHHKNERADRLRKVTISFALLLATASACVANEKITPAFKQPFNGLYAGVFAGMGNRKVETSFDTSGIDELPLSYNIQCKYTKWRKFKGFIGGAFVGYGVTQNKLYVGGELSAHYEDLNKPLKASFTGALRDPSTGARANITGENKLSYKRSPVISPTLRFGFMPAKDNLVYVRIGCEISKDKVESKTAITGRNTATGATKTEHITKTTKNFTKAAFVPGVGFEQAYGSYLLRLEYTYNLGASIKDDGDKLKYTQHSIKLGLAYQF